MISTRSTRRPAEARFCHSKDNGGDTQDNVGRSKNRFAQFDVGKGRGCGAVLCGRYGQGEQSVPAG